MNENKTLIIYLIVVIIIVILSIKYFPKITYKLLYEKHVIETIKNYQNNK